MEIGKDLSFGMSVSDPIEGSTCNECELKKASVHLDMAWKEPEMGANVVVHTSVDLCEPCAVELMTRYVRRMQ